MNSTINPLIKKFKTEKHYYIYDTWTNEILKVHPDFWNYIVDADNNGSCNQTEFKASKIEEIQCEIDKAKMKGYLSTDRPQVSLYTGNNKWKEEIAFEINHNLNQLILNVTESCNYRCDYCSYSDHYPHMRNHSSKYMSWSIAKKAITYAIEHSDYRSKKNLPLSIAFYGGEPLLNLSLIKKSVAFCKNSFPNKNIIFTMTTNGSLINDKIAKFLIENNFAVIFSIDGPEHLHNRYRKTINGQPTFFKTVNGYNLVKRLNGLNINKKAKISINCVMPPPFFLNDIKDFVNSFEDDIVLQLPSDYNTTFYNQFNMNKEFKKFSLECEKIFEEYRNSLVNTDYQKNRCKIGSLLFNDRLLPIKRRKMEPMKAKTTSHGQCIIGGRKLFVTCDGKFLPCERVADKFIIGNIETGINFNYIYDLIENLSEIYSNLCNNCWAIRLCRKCISTVDPSEGINSETFCSNKKINIEKDLIKFCSILELDPNALDFMKDILIS